MTIPLMEGYMAVTGPNGSGKSNITDAILFVLGPKSSKAIRAGKLTDLIFDGGKTGKKAQYTKVSLVFDNSDGILPWNDTTVRLTRLVKMSPNGEDYTSHFYINDQKSTLSEFESLLSKARISADGYNLVQQGDVTRIVQMGAIERRRVLDSISGIASYDADISRAQSERATATENLERISFILDELGRQIDALKKDMDAATKYLTIQDRLKMSRAQMIFRNIEDRRNELAGTEKNHIEAIQALDSIKQDISFRLQLVSDLKAEVDEVICWLTGYDADDLQGQLDKEVDLTTFYAEAPCMNPTRDLIKGVVCGIRVEDIEDPLMKTIRQLDKLVDELAKGKSMDKILRK